MNSKHPDNDIDHIFKDGVDRAETEPSDKFWNRTYEDIIKRENRIYGKQMRRWKIISYSLGTAIILLASYMFYMHSTINNVEKQITEVEKKQATVISNENIHGTATNNPGNRNRTATVLNSKVIANHESGRTTIFTGKKYTAVSASNNNEVAINKTINAEQNKPEGLTRVSANNSSPGSNNVGAEKNPLNSSYGFGNKMPPGNYYNDTTGSSIVSKNSNLALTPSSPDSSLIAKNDNPTVVLQNGNTPLADSTPNDTIKPIANTKNPIPSKSVLSHIYVLAYFSPELSKNIINVNNTADNEMVNTIKNGQTQEATYSTGIKIGYDLSKNWSVLTGVYYHAASFALLSRVVYAHGTGNTANYSIVTGNGTLQMPGYIAQYTDDSLKASGTSSWAYLGIPLQARYDFLPGSKLDFYAEAGFAANFLLNTNTTLNWEGSWGSGPCTINNYNGLQNVFFVYNLGVGATYNFAKRFSIFAEPGMQGPITPISKNSSVTNYPYIMDLTLGLTINL